ncbi:MAG: hypothetical protein AAGA56_19215, partial [Myxococcota bacterium]
GHSPSLAAKLFFSLVGVRLHVAGTVVGSGLATEPRRGRGLEADPEEKQLVPGQEGRPPTGSLGLVESRRASLSDRFRPGPTSPDPPAALEAL